MILPVKLALIVIFGQVIEWIGKPKLTEWLSALIGIFSPSALQKQQRQLKKDILLTQSDLRATSSQDEFAKWAKTRRRLDKLIADLDVLNKNITEQRSNLSKIVTGTVFILTSVLPFFYTSKHRSTPVLYLPHEWFGPAEWFLALPFAPTGALSCAVWTMAVRRTISLSVEAGKSLVPAQPVQTAPASVLNTTQSTENETKHKSL